jgi:hypothetical protein
LQKDNFLAKGEKIDNQFMVLQGVVEIVLAMRLYGRMIVFVQINKEACKSKSKSKSSEPLSVAGSKREIKILLFEARWSSFIFAVLVLYKLRRRRRVEILFQYTVPIPNPSNSAFVFNKI